MRTLRCLLALGLAVPLTMAPLRGETAEELLQEVRAKYESIRDAKLTFTQHVRFSLAMVSQTTRGTLLMKKPSHYRVELESQTIVTDGETVWSYSRPNKQVLIDHFALDERSLSPERLLTTAPKEYTATMLGEEELEGSTVQLVKLIPKSQAGIVASLKLWVDERTSLMRKVEILDVNGKETTYTVHSFEVNPGIADSTFRFTIPEGVDVVDLS
jgi:chaperone LolA